MEIFSSAQEKGLEKHHALFQSPIVMFGMSARGRIPLLVLHDVHNRAVRAAHADADQLAEVRNQAVKAVIQNAVLRVDAAAFQRQTRRFHRKPRA